MFSIYTAVSPLLISTKVLVSIIITDFVDNIDIYAVTCFQSCTNVHTERERTSCPAQTCEPAISRLRFPDSLFSRVSVSIRQRGSYSASPLLLSYKCSRALHRVLILHETACIGPPRTSKRAPGDVEHPHLPGFCNVRALSSYPCCLLSPPSLIAPGRVIWALARHESVESNNEGAGLSLVCLKSRRISRTATSRPSGSIEYAACPRKASACRRPCRFPRFRRDR